MGIPRGLHYIKKVFGNDFILGVHIRRTDKNALEKYFEALDSAPKEMKFFVCSDDKASIEAIKTRYGDKRIITLASNLDYMALALCIGIISSTSLDTANIGNVPTFIIDAPSNNGLPLALQYEKVVIHSTKASERMPVINDLRRMFASPVKIVQAFDGSAWMKDPNIKKSKSLNSFPITPGILGCAQTHLDIIEKAQKEGKEGICIFEDDCFFKVSQDTVKKFCEAADKATGKGWDILFFGAINYVVSTPIDSDLCKPKEVWGSHAIVIRKSAYKAMLDAFTSSQSEGTFYPADHLYNRAIKDSNLVTVGPKEAESLCEQKKGLKSLLRGGTR